MGIEDVLTETLPSGWRFRNPSPRIIPVGAPAAGADWSYTFPYDNLVRLTSVRAQLATSTAVANRNVRLRIRGPTDNVLLAIPLTASITASSTATAHWAQGMANAYKLGSVYVTGMIDGLLPPHCNVETITGAIAAGDQWSGIVLLAELV